MVLDQVAVIGLGSVSSGGPTVVAGSAAGSSPLGGCRCWLWFQLRWLFPASVPSGGWWVGGRGGQPWENKQGLKLSVHKVYPNLFRTVAVGLQAAQHLFVL